MLRSQKNYESNATSAIPTISQFILKLQKMPFMPELLFQLAAFHLPRHSIHIQNG
jgi:hypothetical protein